MKMGSTFCTMDDHKAIKAAFKKTSKKMSRTSRAEQVASATGRSVSTVRRIVYGTLG